jgi:GT2 family glycosyltransferase
MLPPVTVLWLNYNSTHLIDVTKKSLDAIFALDYPDLEIILIDNNSSDGSREWIEKYLKQKPANSTVSFLRLKANLGFAGAANVAYKKLDPKTKYLALTHNDVVPHSGYLKTIVKFMENHPEVGAAQGIVAKFGEESTVDSSGLTMNESLFVSSKYNGGPVEAYQKATYVSIVEGAMPTYNLEAAKAALNRYNELFISEGFMYYLEDAFVSLKLWANGSKCIVLPTVTGAHYRMGTSNKAAKKGDLFYYLLRNRIALLYMTNSNGKLGFLTQNLRKLIVSNRTMAERKAILISMIHGVELGWQLKRRYGGINFYAAPFTRDSFKRRLYRWIH